MPYHSPPGGKCKLLQARSYGAMKRRDVISLLCGTAVGLYSACAAVDRMRRIGVLMAQGRPEPRTLMTAFREGPGSRRTKAQHPMTLAGARSMTQRRGNDPRKN